MSRKADTVNRNQRIIYIRKRLSRSDGVSITKLSEEIKVSEMTVRRDLELLKSQREVIIARGIATSARRLTFEFTFRAQQQKNRKHKMALAKKAIRHVRNDQVIILDTGTTTLEIARHLVGRRKIKVITTSLAIVSELQFDSDIEIILLGGQLRDGSPDLHGSLTEQCLETFRADIAFVGADAVGSNGNTYTGDIRVLNLDRKIKDIARKVIVVADSSKLGQDSMCKIFTSNDYHLLITNSGADDRIIRRIRKRGIRIELA